MRRGNGGRLLASRESTQLKAWPWGVLGAHASFVEKSSDGAVAGVNRYGKVTRCIRSRSNVFVSARGWFNLSGARPGRWACGQPAWLRREAVGQARQNFIRGRTSRRRASGGGEDVRREIGQAEKFSPGRGRPRSAPGFVKPGDPHGRPGGLVRLPAGGIAGETPHTHVCAEKYGFGLGELPLPQKALAQQGACVEPRPPSGRAEVRSVRALRRGGSALAYFS